MKSFFEFLDSAPEYTISGKLETMDIVFKMSHRELDYEIEDLDYSKFDLENITDAIEYLQNFQDEDTIDCYSSMLDNYQNLIHVSADLYLIQDGLKSLLNRTNTFRRFV